jgi:hypothetical protein
MQARGLSCRAYQGGRRPRVPPPHTSNKPKTLGFVPQPSLHRLTVGLTFSTIAKTQLQAMQMGFFFFLPSLLLSGFMFPFRGMPAWAQTLGELLPLTHFLICRLSALLGLQASPRFPGEACRPHCGAKHRAG